MRDVILAIFILLGCSFVILLTIPIIIKFMGWWFGLWGVVI